VQSAPWTAGFELHGACGQHGGALLNARKADGEEEKEIAISPARRMGNKKAQLARLNAADRGAPATVFWESWV